MQTNTFYYTLSVMPQVIAAITAVMAAFAFFRIANLKDYLIGDGKSVLNRWGDAGYNFPDKRDDTVWKKRLSDAVDRKNIPEIKEVISHLSMIEAKAGYSKKMRPRGLQYLYEDWFCGIEKHIDQLKRWALLVVALSFTLIAASVVSLALTDAIMATKCTGLCYLVLWLNVALFAVSLGSALYLMYLGLIKKIKHETDL